MSTAWQTCPHCSVYFQPQSVKSNGEPRCPGCGKVLRSSTLKDSQWFYASKKQKFGPVTWAGVRELALSGKLSRKDMVLQEGSGKWVPADSVTGLFTDEAHAVTWADNGKAETPAHGTPRSSDNTHPLLSSDTDTPRPAVLGYEILGELGRGGMGVVYKARHLRLNRIVALKMILAGAHAGSKEHKRFRSEAEAVARLQHPNIVQIHEVGESEGRPYFSLEYVDGGSLAQRLDGTPQAARQSAQLIEALARAMNVAHQQNIVHRDLKPANVLLNRDGTPKITDFGLAKQMDSEHAQTGTGAILGTPSYMAPEQAAGRTREIGPAADVYALGAILYELLTGRPPFRGETPMDTMFQAISQEPVPPTRLQPKVPRDLETICLKCLQKEPAKRYPSALALAEDLQRFRSNLPIEARPVGIGERTLKWMRRRPAVAALVLVCGLAAGGLMLGSWFYSAKVTWALNVAQRNADEARHQEELAHASFQKRIEEVDQLITRLDGRLAITPNSETLRMEFLQEFRRSSEGILQENPNDPSARRQIAFVHRLIGDVWYQSFRDYAKAEETYQKALAMQKQLVDEYPEEPIYRTELAKTHAHRARMYQDQKKYEPAQAEFKEALRHLDELARLVPSADNREAAANERVALALCLQQAGKLKDSEKLLRDTVAMQEKIAADFPDRAVARVDLGRSSEYLAMLVGEQDRASHDNLRRNAEQAREAARQVAPEQRKQLQARMEALQQVMGQQGTNQNRQHHKRGARLAWGVARPTPLAPGAVGAEKAGEGKKDDKNKAVDGVQKEAGILMSEPEIEGVDLDNKPISLDDYEGKVVVISFWADWNAHCHKQYPQMKELVCAMKDRPFALVGVNCDEDRKVAKTAAEKHGLNFRSCFDGRWGAIAQQWKVQTYPTNFVLDHHGTIRFRNIHGKELDAAVQKLVKECEEEKKK
jgi:peroxiredoxin/tetratricopeptide (TPR) repeat protein/tRNA A-37 threonylcarbamoyl transferase component Bud32